MLSRPGHLSSFGFSDSQFPAVLVAARDATGVTSVSFIHCYYHCAGPTRAAANLLHVKHISKQRKVKRVPPWLIPKRTSRGELAMDLSTNKTY